MARGMEAGSGPGVVRYPRYLSGLVALLVVLVAGASTANAATPPLYGQVPGGDGASGAEAGRFDQPRDLAAAPNPPGHLYVADLNNNRIDELTAYGDFVRAWGWGVRDGASELQSCTAASGCRAGIAGSGAGQLNQPEAIAVDANGDVYVVDRVNRRVQKFDAEGNFLLAFGREVDETTGGDICTAASGDQCGPGVGGSGPGQLGASFEFYYHRLTTSPSGGTVYLGGLDRIQEWDADGTYKGEISYASLHAQEPDFPEQGTPLALDSSPSSGDLYLIQNVGPSEQPVFELTPTGELTGTTFASERGTDVAISTAGDAYISQPPDIFESVTPTNTSKILHYSPSGKVEEPFDVVDFEEGSGITGVATGSGCGAEDVYAAHFLPGTPPTRSYVKIFGAAPDPGVCPPAQAAPTISAQYATAVGTDTASLGASINPNSQAETTFYVEYGLQPCREGGCQAQPLAPGRELGGASGEPLDTPPIELTGLASGATYHYRFVAQSSGGGPVYGIAPAGSEASFAEGLEGTFTTFGASTPEACSNSAFRTGFSATLPDCRAYEQVSPVDKEGGDVIALEGTATNYPSVLDQSSLSGEKLTYGSYRSFGGAESAPYTAQYVATREATGWRSHAVSPPRSHAFFYPANSTYAEYKLFDSELCDSWLVSLSDPPLAPGAPAGFSDAYRRHDEECGGERSYLPLNTQAPAQGVNLEVQGVSEDGSVTAFASSRKLLPQGTEGAGNQLYVSNGVTEKFACILPGGSPFSGECGAGYTESAGNPAILANVAGALSSDGSRLYWTAGSTGEGPIYLRENPLAPGLECAGAGRPCTVPVSQAAEEASGGAPSHYWAAAADGSRAIFSVENIENRSALYEYEVSGANTRRIAGRVRSVVGASADAERIYFVSEEDLDGPGPAAASGLNLYYHARSASGGSTSFIGALTARDLSGVEFSAGADTPRFHTARVSPDGLHLTFSAFAPLTGYDNVDAESGERDTEVYLYDATTGRLVCPSCNPGGSRPHGANINEFRGVENVPYWVAGFIPPYENSLYASKLLRDDGRRLIFESIDGLTPADTNGQMDVYEWEDPGTGGCTFSSGSYSLSAGGCVSLISSGTSPRASEVADVSPSGEDVFFTTLESLVPRDPGQVDMYDARVNGGFPTSTVPGECEGADCQHPSPAPEGASPGSSAHQGSENLSPQRPRCGKGKVLRGKRCVKRHKRHKRRHKHHVRKHRPGKNHHHGKTGSHNHKHGGQAR